MNQTLNLKRLGFLARKDLFQYWRGVLIVAAGNTGVMILITLLGIIFGSGNPVDYNGWFTGLTVIWGCIAASLAFEELYDKNRNQDFLLLPASALEKTMVRLLWVSLVRPLFIIVLMMVDSLIAESIVSLIQGGSMELFNPFDSGRKISNPQIIGYTIVIQSIFFLGAAWFRKARFIKTVLSAVVISTVFGLLIIIQFSIMFASYKNGDFNSVNMYFNLGDFAAGPFREFFRVLRITMQIIGFALLPPFCWFVAWIRVKEAQSSYGV